MDIQKISKRFEQIEVVPGNGHSPYTGCLIFWCHDTHFNKSVTVKASDGIKNVHRTVEKEYEFLKEISHPGIIKAIDYYKEGDVGYMVMEGVYKSGGRRERWQRIFSEFNEDTAEFFLKSLMEILVYLQQHNILHGDIECANMVYNAQTIEPILIDFGRAERKQYSLEWLVDQLKLNKVNKLNTFFREISNTAGVYVNEPRHFNFDIKPIIEEVLRNV